MGLGEVSARCAIAALAGLLPCPAPAQDLPDVDYQADRHEAAEKDATIGLLATGNPWTLSFTAPFSWQSNLASSHSGGTSGISVDPELSIERAWTIGPLTLSATGAFFISAPEPDPSLDVSGWYATIELAAGNPSSGLAPYLSYDPVAVHAGVMGANLLTRHALSAGVRRNFGSTSFDLSAIRAPTSTNGANRTALHLVATQRWMLGRTAFQLRGDLEQRWYDRAEGAESQRQVTRARIRARAIVPLDPAVDLMLNAQWERHWSADEAWDFNNITIGPTLVARFGF